MCGAVFVFVDRAIQERPTLKQHENGDVFFRGRACERCFGMEIGMQSEYRMVVLG